jgi:hypothetical protein
MRKYIWDLFILFILFVLFLVVFVSSSAAQNVGINQNGSAAHASAMLDITSTNKGLLIPRMTTNQRTGIPTPATGLLVYDTDINTFMYFNGSGWTSLSAAAAPGGNEWKVQGNSGTDPSINFVGTIDSTPLNFRLNNLRAGKIDFIGNAFFGFKAGLNSTTGGNNVAIGGDALSSNVAGSYLIAIGDSALFANNGGYNNTAVGSRALSQNTGGTDNTAIGRFALNYNKTGNANTALGSYALQRNTGSNNTAAGTAALAINTTGSNNNAFGYFALHDNIDGQGNNAFGTLSLQKNTSGTSNNAMGYQALKSNTTGMGNIAMGSSALYANQDGDFNLAIGHLALTNNTTGHHNNAIGNNALVANISGQYNTAVGSAALNQGTSGIGNTAIGGLAMQANTASSYNTCLGYNATLSGFANLTNATAIGSNAFVSGSNSLVLGSIAGVNGALSTINVGIGTTTPKTRLQIEDGLPSGYGSNDGYLVIGSQLGINLSFDNNEILARSNGSSAPLFLQTLGGYVKIGSGGNPNYQLELSTNSAGKPGSNTWTIVSDARLKKDVKDFKDGLSVIKQINPVWFRYNGEAGIKDTAQFVGILAQDIKKIAPYMVGEKKLKDEKGNQSSYLNYDGNAMTYILINAIKEQQQMIESLTKQNQEITKKLQEIEKLK